MSAPPDIHEATPAPSTHVDDPDSSRALISEQDFAQLLSIPLSALRRVLDATEAPAAWAAGEPACRRLTELALDTEAFLDDFDARSNARFALLRELVAALHTFAECSAIGHHILRRLPNYPLEWPDHDQRELKESLNGVLAFSLDAVQSLASAVELEARRAEVPHHESRPALPECRPAPGAVHTHLPHTIGLTGDESDDASSTPTLRRLIAGYERTTADVQRLWKSLAGDDGPTDALVERAAKQFDETVARRLEGDLHNLQSAYDTHVRFSDLEQREPSLAAFRGHVALAFHLAEWATRLVHFSERHERAVHHPPTRETVAALIDRHVVLESAVQVALRWLVRALETARPAVDAFQARLAPEHELTLELPPNEMLHARPLSLITRIVTHHGSAVELCLEDECARADSILSLLLLASRHPQERTVRLRGDPEALADLKALFAANFDLEQVPHALARTLADVSPARTDAR